MGEAISDNWIEQEGEEGERGREGEKKREIAESFSGRQWRRMDHDRKTYGKPTVGIRGGRRHLLWLLANHTVFIPIAGFNSPTVKERDFSSSSSSSSPWFFSFTSAYFAWMNSFVFPSQECRNPPSLPPSLFLSPRNCNPLENLTKLCQFCGGTYSPPPPPPSIALSIYIYIYRHIYKRFLLWRYQCKCNQNEQLKFLIWPFSIAVRTDGLHLYPPLKKYRCYFSSCCPFPVLCRTIIQLNEWDYIVDSWDWSQWGGADEDCCTDWCSSWGPSSTPLVTMRNSPPSETLPNSDQIQSNCSFFVLLLLLLLLSIFLPLPFPLRLILLLFVGNKRICPAKRPGKRRLLQSVHSWQVLPQFSSVEPNQRLYSSAALNSFNCGLWMKLGLTDPEPVLFIGSNWFATESIVWSDSSWATRHNWVDWLGFNLINRMCWPSGGLIPSVESIDLLIECWVITEQKFKVMEPLDGSWS